MPSCQNENVYLRMQKNRENIKEIFFVFDATVSDGAV